MASEIHKELEVHQFKTPASMSGWLKRSGKPDSSSIWLKIAKKNSGERSVSYEQARETAIRYGWIDGLMNKYDDKFYLIKFSPRRPKSSWSKINRGIAIELIKSQRMMPQGMQQVEAAKADGRWQAAYDSPRTIQVPNDLKELLGANPTASRTFEQLGSADRYAFLIRLQSAKREATRTKRLRETIEKLSLGETFYSSSSKKSASVKLSRFAMLLRGVNVGGHRIVKMLDLRDELEKAGLKQVATYIQSGNIVCSSSLRASAIAELVESVIRRSWGFDVHVQVYSLTSWRRILAACPFDEPSKKLVFTLLDRSVPTKRLKSVVSKLINETEQVEVVGRVIYLYCPDGLSKSRFSQDVLKRELGVMVTSRNWNTMDKIDTLLRDK